MVHLIPFKGRNHSGPVTQNLLWRDKNVYLMDNHRAALWCWQQHIDLNSAPHSLLHIDRHYDALKAHLGRHTRAMPQLAGLSIHDYLGAQVALSSSVELFRWDNYISLYLKKIRPQLSAFQCATHQEGDKPNFKRLREALPDDLPGNTAFWLSLPGPWIVNLDLDFFFFEGQREQYTLMFSQPFIEATFLGIRDQMEAGNVAVVTVCLTPSNFTPGWQACIDLSKSLFKILKVRHPKI